MSPSHKMILEGKATGFTVHPVSACISHCIAMRCVAQPLKEWRWRGTLTAPYASWDMSASKRTASGIHVVHGPAVKSYFFACTNAPVLLLYCKAFQCAYSVRSSRALHTKYIASDHRHTTAAHAWDSSTAAVHKELSEFIHILTALHSPAFQPILNVSPHLRTVWVSQTPLHLYMLAFIIATTLLADHHETQSPMQCSFSHTVPGASVGH